MTTLADTTRQSLDLHRGMPLAVAFSGGNDSSALLDVLARLPCARKRGLRAIHVNHGLQPQAGAWADHCQRFCLQRDIRLSVVAVEVRHHGQGPEAAAREARMAAFAAHMQAGEALLLAHHRADQAETIVLKLLRGAGAHGLAGMHPWRAFAHGWLWRPWLDLDPRLIADWLASHHIEAIRDPANADPGMTRSWLRHEIMPRLRAHLPNADASIVHSGRVCAEVRDHLEQQLDGLNHLIGSDGSLDARAWLAQPAALRGLLLERWLHRRGHTAPSTAQRRELERQSSHAGADRLPQVHWPGTDVRLWRGRLHAMHALAPRPSAWQARWHGQELQLPLGSLHLASTTDATPPRVIDPPLRVRLRGGGERLQPAGERHSRSLAAIFQRAGLPPWLRPYCPLVYAQDELLAVADLCFSASGRDRFAELGATPRWRYHV